MGAPSGARRAEKRRPSPGWEEVGQCGEEAGEGRGPSKQPAGKLASPRDMRKGKAHEKFLLQRVLRGGMAGGSRFLSGGRALLPPSTQVWPLRKHES